MATYRLASIVITDPVDAAFLVNDQVVIMWNDSTQAITVEKNGASFTTAGSLLGDLDVNYRITIGVSSTSGGYAVAGYSFCNGLDLNWFQMVTFFPQYPFFEKKITVDSPVCATGGTGAVCDIAFAGPPIIVHSTDKSTGGSITVTAISSNGTVRYGLRNNDWSDMTNTTGVFTGLIPGNWTLYAKDANDCTAILNFKILYKPTDTEHYRFSFRSALLGSQGTPFNGRVRIYEREYVGDVVEIERGDESPFSILKPRAGDFNNKLTPIHPTGAELILYSLEDYQFLPLFTQDPKRYMVVYEIEETPVHSGFIAPSVYQEDFISVPYTVTFRIGDNVKTLEREPFADDNGNLLNGSMKLIKVIAFIMKKTGLSLKIKSGINIFETNHTTAATDDPLDQTYIDVACYRDGTEPFTCWEVLEAILKPFGARIYQSDNQWLIEETDRAHEGYAYRIFTADGTYESNGTATADDVVIDVKGSSYTDRAAMIDEDHLMEIIPAYGKVKITNELNYVGSMIAGGFEKEDLLSPESEEQSNANGIFQSEEGFRDWTLRMPTGVSGVSFGRSVVLTDDNTVALKRLLDADKATSRETARSVGAFYFSPGSWSGNVRNAYIESAAKAYQYGPGGEIKLSFDYSTPSTAENIPFMVLRFALKVGSNWLQEDGSWGLTEDIYRAYPTPSTKLQTFEMYIALPEVTIITDTTLQLRIYYYAAGFYDFGMPSATTSPSGGTHGLTDLVNFPTVGLDYDYMLDVRSHKTTGSVTNYFRTYAELRISDAAEDIGAGILHPADFNSLTNPKIWWSLGAVIENNKTLSADRATVRDTLFFLDNVSVDALINGQEPPRDESIQLEISKQINETLEVTLYNADRPTIVNGKNMYNNFFRLADGTPTVLWNRSGLVDYLPLSSILLKVLGSQHSAPTFRISGTFTNEFRRIGINNYIRITKPGANVTATNTEFTTDLSGWEQSVGGESFSWSAGTAQVTLNGAVSSKKLYQQVTHKGGYIQISTDISITPSVGNSREDIMWAVFYRGSDIVHTEKLRVLPLITSLSDLTFTHKAFVPGYITKVGLFFQYISGSGQCVYNVSKFQPEGVNIQEVYQITDYQSNERTSEYNLELMQMSKTYISLSGIDTGNPNQGGSTNGREHDDSYSSAYS